MKIGVCIRCKDEEKVICDWVKYYIKLGFDKIIIYDNLSNPSIEQILKNKNLLIENKVFIHIDNFIGNGQHIIYQNCIDENKDLDWLLLCDPDEFIYCKDNNIKNFLNNFSEDTVTIVINWLVFGSGGNRRFDYTKSVFEQFTKREDYTHFWNHFVKSFIRPKLIENFGNVHTTCNLKYKTKNVYNEEVKFNYPRDNEIIDRKLSSNTPVVIVHYMTLDIESMQQKRQRNMPYGIGVDINNPKYTLNWYYNNSLQGFKDNNEDLRMLKYI